MLPKQSRAVIVLDGVYSSKCDARISLRQQGREPETLAEFEAALDALIHATAMPRFRLEWRIGELRDREERGRALTCVAPLPFAIHE